MFFFLHLRIHIYNKNILRFFSSLKKRIVSRWLPNLEEMLRIDQHRSKETSDDEDIEEQRALFRLKAILLHHGQTINAGHYTCKF